VCTCGLDRLHVLRQVYLRYDDLAVVLHRAHEVLAMRCMHVVRSVPRARSHTRHGTYLGDGEQLAVDALPVLPRCVVVEPSHLLHQILLCVHSPSDV
jgi:hypothetical protein